MPKHAQSRPFYGLPRVVRFG